jgi:hypothetical protein
MTCSNEGVTFCRICSKLQNSDLAAFKEFLDLLSLGQTAGLICAS